jgi:phospholipase C
VPAFAISAWIPERTVVTSQYRHTSVIATLRKRWRLGDPLTARDAIAADLAPVLTRETPRDPQDWPQAVPRLVPSYPGKIPAPEVALRGLGRASLAACLSLVEHRGKASPQLTSDEDISRADAIALLADLAGDVFVRLPGG